MDESTAARLWSKIDKDGPETARLGRCWGWRGKPGKGGYPYFWFDGKSRRANRFVYENLVGPIPEGLVIDHVCHNEDLDCPGGDLDPHRLCTNPDHLIATDQLSNVMAGRGIAARNAAMTECDSGHDLLDPGNVYTYPNGRERACIPCVREAQKRWRAKRYPDAVPMAERTECPAKHPYDSTNTRVNAYGYRVCRECVRERDRETKRLQREAAKAAGLTVRDYLASKRV